MVQNAQGVVRYSPCCPCVMVWEASYQCDLRKEKETGDEARSTRTVELELQTWAFDVKQNTRILGMAST